MSSRVLHLATTSILTVDDLAPSFRLSLQAENLSPRTVTTYTDALLYFSRYLHSQGMPLEVTSITREHCEAWLASLLSGVSPLTGRPYSSSTASTMAAGLRRFWRWLLDKGEVTRNPMERMKPVKVTQPQRRVLTDQELDRLLKPCQGRDFNSRRDRAILLLLAHTGVRSAELLDLRLDDIDLERRTALVRQGKGRKPRVVTFSRRAANALADYVTFSRARHEAAQSDWLWLGSGGPKSRSRSPRLTRPGLYSMIIRRGEAVGLPGLHPHLFRHYYIDMSLRRGMPEGAIMQQTGHKRRNMLDVYGASAAQQRSHEIYRSLNIGDD